MPDQITDSAPAVLAGEGLAQAPNADAPEPAGQVSPARVPAISELAVHVHFTLWPADGNDSGRLVTMWARALGDDPLMRSFREAEFGELPSVIRELLAAVEADLPACSERLEQARLAEETARQQREAAAAQVRARCAAASKRRTASTATRPPQPEQARLAAETAGRVPPDTPPDSPEGPSLRQIGLFDGGNE